MELVSARHAFITGGASGLGLGMAQVFVERGIKVSIADANRESLAAVLKAAPANLRGTYLDVRDRAGWAAAKAEAEAAFGPVDILVNNAGIAPDGWGFAEMEPESFDRIIAINLTGVFNGISAFAADMRSRGRGHIVNTSSMAGISSSLPSAGAYATSKFGVVGLSESLRAELEPHGVGVSVLCPGIVATQLMENTEKMGGRLRERPTVTLDSGVTAADVGALVLKGIADNAAYILTSAEDWWPMVEARHLDLREAFERAGVDLS